MNSEYYNLQNIKNIPIVDYLHACGIQPVKKYGSYALYNAPYREDHNASMKVDFTRNLWYDFGLGKGGSIIDLVMLLQGCDAHKAMSLLAGNNLSFHSVTPPKEKVAALFPSARRILGISEELPPTPATLFAGGTQDRPFAYQTLSVFRMLRGGRKNLHRHRIFQSCRRV